MNTLYADPYALLDLRTEYRINDSVTVFGEVSNVFDKTYAAATLIVDQARPDQAAFQPGTGRAFYAGLKARF
jgi:iron complex outermembrane receptor protein